MPHVVNTESLVAEGVLSNEGAAERVGGDDPLAFNAILEGLLRAGGDDVRCRQ